MKEIVRKTKFDDWCFSMYDDGRLRVGFIAQDNYRPEVVTGFSLILNAPGVAHRTDVDSFLSWQMSKIEKIVLHEAQEKFLFDGTRVFDPHANRKTSLNVDFSRFTGLYHTKLREG